MAGISALSAALAGEPVALAGEGRAEGREKGLPLRPPPGLQGESPRVPEAQGQNLRGLE